MRPTSAPNPTNLDLFDRKHLGITGRRLVEVCYSYLYPQCGGDIDDIIIRYNNYQFDSFMLDHDRYELYRKNRERSLQ